MRFLPGRFLFLPLLSPLAHAELIDDVFDRGELRIALEANTPPFNFKEADKLTGFEVELGELLAKEMDVRASFITVDAADLLSGVESAKYDVAINHIAMTPELADRFAFSEGDVCLRAVEANLDGQPAVSVGDRGITGIRAGRIRRLEAFDVDLVGRNIQARQSGLDDIHEGSRATDVEVGVGQWPDFLNHERRIDESVHVVEAMNESTPSLQPGACHIRRVPSRTVQPGPPRRDRAARRAEPTNPPHLGVQASSACESSRPPASPPPTVTASLTRPLASPSLPLPLARPAHHEIAPRISLQVRDADDERRQRHKARAGTGTHAATCELCGPRRTRRRPRDRLRERTAASPPC